MNIKMQCYNVKGGREKKYQTQDKIRFVIEEKNERT